MKALSIRSDFAYLILRGDKTIECRTWQTKYRGDILICANSLKIPYTVPGHALCVCELLDIVQFTEEHLEDACMNEMPEKKSFAWLFDSAKIIWPVPVKGKLSLFNYDGPIEYIDEENPAEYIKTLKGLIV